MITAPAKPVDHAAIRQRLVVHRPKPPAGAGFRRTYQAGPFIAEEDSRRIRLACSGELSTPYLERARAYYAEHLADQSFPTYEAAKQAVDAAEKAIQQQPERRPFQSDGPARGVLFGRAR